jgi:hypothetical protein
MKEQQKIKKGKPRGRPFKPGQSGNPAGRPRGSLNKITLALLEGARRAEEELAKPKLLDMSRPYESWDGYFFQDGLRFDKYTLEAIPLDDPLPVQPERLNPRERRTPVLWKRRHLILQNGWAYDPATWQAVKI